jgi:prepilin-type N-terminal cleavage/methylation domain-containing protein
MDRAKDMRSKARGFTLVEVMVTITVFAILALGMGAILSRGYTSARALDEQASVTATANTLLGRVNTIQFGTTRDAAPTSAQINEFFDSDADLGTITFQQLRMAQGANGYISFTIAGLSGDARLIISNDLNGDGDAVDTREGRTDIYRVEVRYNNNMILKTYRTAPVQH